MRVEHRTLLGWRHWLHQHPELAYQEQETSGFIQETLTHLGVDFKAGVGGTGVVAHIQGRKPGPKIGLRADFDALPIHELNQSNHRSIYDGRMHACGHDGHTTMLLGACAELVAADFAGEVFCIFQPAEEGGAGAKAMIDDGLWSIAPVDQIYAVHNWPGIPTGQIAVHSNRVMAAANQMSISLKGVGGHAAMPQDGNDLILAASQLITRLNTLVSREVSPLEPAVISVCKINAGNTFNVLPEKVDLLGTVRSFNIEVESYLLGRITEISQRIAADFNAVASVEFSDGYPPTINHRGAANYISKVASAHSAGPLLMDQAPSMAAEDFAFMLGDRPGCYFWMGNGTQSASLHTPNYDFNDNLLEQGVALWVDIVKNAVVL